MKIETISSFEHLIHNQNKKTLYRGQANADWELVTSLERTCHSMDGSLEYAMTREQRLNFLFKRRYHNFTTNIPDFDDELRWLAIMQHHGAPTRLLDCSYSILVAAYFAVEKTSTDAAVWQIDNNWLRHNAVKYLEKKGVRESSLNVTMQRVSKDESKKRFCNIYMSNKYRFVRSLSPYFRDRRLTAQQGTFLCSGDVSVSFMDNLTNICGNSDGIKKYVIPKTLHKEILYNLYASNISRATLFPGLDGFAAALSVFHPTIWK